MALKSARQLEAQLKKQKDDMDAYKEKAAKDLEEANKKTEKYKQHAHQTNKLDTALEKLASSQEQLASSIEGMASKKKDTEEPANKCEFAFSGAKIITVQYEQMLCDGIQYCMDIKPSVRDSIGRDEFVSLGKLLHDTAEGVNLYVDMKSANYMTRNVPPPPDDIRSLVELLQRLFLFGSYYLQLYPQKTVSFLDYMLFLIDYSDTLTVEGLSTVDHYMRQQFATHPEWSWSQYRDGAKCALDRVIHKDKFKRSKPQYFAQNFQQSGSKFKSNPTQSQNNKRKGGPTKGGSKPKKQKTKEEMSNEVCLRFNSAGGCKWKNDCYRRHVCINCHGSHKNSACSGGTKL